MRIQLCKVLKGFAPAAGPLTCKNPHICEAVSRELQVSTVSDEISCELFLVNVKRLVLLGGNSLRFVAAAYMPQ